MSSIPDWERRRVRSLFVSDVHLGCRHSQAEEFLAFLQQHQPKYLYIIGDFIDGWKLRRRWRWRPEYDKILKHLLHLHCTGTKLRYAPGNHDSFLRGFLTQLGSLNLLQVRERFIHESADRRRFLVVHGDQFDHIEQNVQWLSRLASIAYDVLLTASRWLNVLPGVSRKRYVVCGAIKRSVKRLVRHISEFERQLVEAAKGHRCHGIICGHVHEPRIRGLGGLAYCNTGDWVENCSALVEYESGQFELVRHDGTVIAKLDRVVGRGPAARNDEVGTSDEAMLPSFDARISPHPLPC
jgi:UDP-2,3-diacylglucosamine pyrophosphatase LpxH